MAGELIPYRLLDSLDGRPAGLVALFLLAVLVMSYTDEVRNYAVHLLALGIAFVLIAVPNVVQDDLEIAIVVFVVALGISLLERRRPLEVLSRVRQRLEVDSPVFLALLVVLAALALLVRFSRLPGTIHPDEAHHARLSWKLAFTGSYKYHPRFHGPLLYHLVAPIYRLFGPSVLAGRMVIAVCSLGVFPCLYWLRNTVAKPALLTAGLFFLANPLVVFTWRFFRQDTLLVVSLLFLCVAYSWYRRDPTRLVSLLFCGALAVPVLAKELAYVLVPSMSIPIVVGVTLEYRTTGELRRAVDAYLPLEHAKLVLAGLSVPLVVFYSSWPPFTNADFMWFPAEALFVWVARSSGAANSATYHLSRFLESAPHLLVLAGIGVVTSVFRTVRARLDDPPLLRWVLVSWLVVGWAFFAFVPDPDLWQMVYLFTPMAILAGTGLHDVAGVLSDLGARDAFPVDPDRWRPTPSKRVYAVALVWLVLSVGVVTYHQALTVDTTRNPYPGDQYYGPFSYVRQEAVDTGCEVFVVDISSPTVDWMLRGLDYEHVADAGSLPSPSILVSNEPLPGNVTGDRSHRNWSRFHTYTPESPCVIAGVRRFEVRDGSAERSGADSHRE